MIMTASLSHTDIKQMTKPDEEALETERVRLKQRIDELKEGMLSAEKAHAASLEQERQAFVSEMQIRDNALDVMGQESASFRSERDDLALRCRALEEQAQTYEHRLAEKESTLAQRAEELHQVWAQLNTEQNRAQALEVDVANVRDERSRESDRLARSEAWVFQLAAERARLERSESAYRGNIDSLRAQLAAEKAQVSRLDAMLTAKSRDLRSVKADFSNMANALKERENELRDSTSRLMLEKEQESKKHINEIVSLARMLREAEQSSKKNASNLDWLKAVYTALGRGIWWWSYLPRSVCRGLELRRLKKHGLFDADAYLERYPDVKQGGQDPLRHYIIHGMFEGRII
jgi:chromosome segregation ATPase